MVAKVQFDERSGYFDKTSLFRNQYLVRKLCKGFADEADKRGYFYLNQLYEYLHIPWDISNENPVFANACICWDKKDYGTYDIVVADGRKEEQI